MNANPNAKRHSPSPFPLPSLTKTNYLRNWYARAIGIGLTGGQG